MIDVAHMKLADYFERCKYSSAWAKNASLNREALSSFPEFREILSSYQSSSKPVSEHRPGGLTVSDYMAYPITARPTEKNVEILHSEATPPKDKSDDLKTDSLFEPLVDSSKSQPSETEEKPSDSIPMVKKSESSESIEAEKMSTLEKIDQSIRKAASKYNLPTRFAQRVQLGNQFFDGSYFR